MAKQTTSAGGVVINPDGKVLVVNQDGLTWSLPKGHIEAGEDARAAAQREIYEESGITQLVFVKDLGKYQRFKIGKDGQDDHSELKTIVLFLFHTNQYELQPKDPNNPEARWVSKEAVADLLTHEKDKEFLRKIIHEM